MKTPEGKDGTRDMVVYFVKSYPWHSLLMVACLLLSGVFEGASIAFFLPLIHLAVGEGTGETSGLENAVRGMLAALGLEPTLPLLLVIIITGITMKGVFMWLAMRQVGYTVAGVARDLRLALITALLRARWSYFTSRPVGVLANAIGTEAQIASQAYQNAAMAAAYLIQLTLYTAIGFLVSWQAALLAVLAGLAVVAILHGLVKLSKRAGQSGTASIKALTSRLVDGLNGIKPIKAMAREESLLPQLREDVRGIYDAQRLKIFAHYTMFSFQEPITVLILAAGMYVFITYLSVPFSALLVLAFLFSRIVNQINPFLRHLQSVVLCESAFWSLWESIELAESSPEKAHGTRIPRPLSESIRFEEVSFSYGNTEILHEVSFELPANRFTALSGLSGAGKTTVADLIIGLQTPREGKVLVDGTDLAEIDLKGWRSLVGYVPQEMFLFHDTVLFNVTLGDGDISREDALQALKAAEAWDFISGLKDGPDTVVGERGSKMSGGQRQRIAIARALARQPSLLILDEVTTSLDPETEKSICATLKKLRGTVTILSISHQPALREVADVVYEVRDRKVLPAADDAAVNQK